MNVKRNKDLEIKIVELTDQLIQTIIASIDNNIEGQKTTLEEANNIIINLSELIHNLIGDETHLVSMLNQLIYQKLPNHAILEEGEFAHILHKVIEKGVIDYQKITASEFNNTQSKENIINNDIETTHKMNNINMIEKVDKFYKVDKTVELNIINNQKVNYKYNDLLFNNLKKLFPDTTILKNYKFHTVKLQYFLPDNNIAFVIEDSHTNSSLQEFICNKNGIKLIKIKNNELPLKNIKKLLKKL